MSSQEALEARGKFLSERANNHPFYIFMDLRAPMSPDTYT